LGGLNREIPWEILEPWVELYHSGENRQFALKQALLYGYHPAIEGVNFIAGHSLSGRSGTNPKKKYPHQTELKCKSIAFSF
jgi:hypothetical protein